MSDYINRQTAIYAVMEAVERNRDDQFGGVLLHYTGIKAMLECIPAADVRPLVQGEWISQDKLFGGVPFECSVCG